MHDVQIVEASEQEGKFYCESCGEHKAILIKKRFQAEGLNTDEQFLECPCGHRQDVTDGDIEKWQRKIVKTAISAEGQKSQVGRTKV